jgi:hypothetical protein
VVHVVAQLKNVWSLRSASTGMLNILCVPSAKNHFWDIGITKNVDWRIANSIIINFLATCASYAIKSLVATVNKN